MQKLRVAKPLPADDYLIFQKGHAKLILHASGELELKNKHSSIYLSAFGDVKIKSNADVEIEAANHIHLNSE